MLDFPHDANGARADRRRAQQACDGRVARRDGVRSGR